MRKLAFIVLAIGLVLWVMDARYPIPAVFFATATVMPWLGRKSSTPSPFAMVSGAMIVLLVMFSLLWFDQYRSPLAKTYRCLGTVTNVRHTATEAQSPGIDQDTLCVRLFQPAVIGDWDIDVIWTDYTNGANGTVKIGDTIAVARDQLSRNPIWVAVTP